jgi:uncharacterized protein
MAEQEQAQVNPFVVAGEIAAADVIDRDPETAELLAHARAGQPFRLVGPRRYGKTTLLARALGQADAEGMATALVDLEGVVSIESIVVRIERAYEQRLKGPVRRAVAAILRSWDIGVSLGGGGFTARLQTSRSVHVESVLQRLLALPATLHERTGRRSFVVFDEVQDLLRVTDAAGAVRSVIQHHAHAASYGFAGSAPGLMRRLFEDPTQPLLEHAVPYPLGPLPAGETGAYVSRRFETTGRDAGAALDPLLTFARGHPQRTMLLAHHLWRQTAAGASADEQTWEAALETALGEGEQALRARWEALPVNEQRMALALANVGASPYDERAYGTVGLKRGSVKAALDGLADRAELVRHEHEARLTDPLLELWLRRRGVH